MKRWVRYYVDRGHEILLLTSRMESIPDVKVVQLPAAFLGKAAYVLSIPWVRKLVRRFNPDIVHGHYVTSYGGMTGRLGLRPFVISAWGSDILNTLSGSGLSSRLMQLFDSSALRNAAAITIESTSLLEPLIRLGVSVQRIEVVPWGVDLDVFNPGYSQEAAQLRSDLKIPIAAPVILSIRSTKQVYNIMLVLSAFEELLCKIPDAVLVIVAGTRDPEYCRVLSAFIASKKLSSSVRLIERVLGAREVAVAINMSDVVVSVPKWDSLSVSLLETLACCRPLVLSQIPANEELVRSGIEAELVGFTSSSVSAGFEHALSMPSAYIQRNLLAVKQRYSWERSTEQMTALYARVTGGEVGR